MGQELAVREQRPQMLTLSNEQLNFISRTEFVPAGLRGNLPAIMACVAAGRALGLPDMTALRSIHIIDGKATFSAELMVQLVRRSGHSITGTVTDGAATVTGVRADNGDEMTVTWTTQMAERAGLLGKQNWKRYPEAMLWARAVSQLCRMLFADCFAGSTYTEEEIGSEAAYEPIEGEIVGTEPGAASADAVAELPVEAASTDESAQGKGPSGPAPSTAQMRKANLLVGKLREAGKITTADLYAKLGHEPVVSEDGELHWSPLRDSLTKVEASTLIDWLEQIDKAGSVAADVAAATELLLAYVARLGADEKLWKETIKKDKAVRKDDAAHLAWLREQVQVAEAQIGAAA